MAGYLSTERNSLACNSGLAQCAHRPLIPAHRINFILLLHNLDKNESIMAFAAHV